MGRGVTLPSGENLVFETSPDPKHLRTGEGGTISQIKFGLEWTDFFYGLLLSIPPLPGRRRRVGVKRNRTGP